MASATAAAMATQAAATGVDHARLIGTSLCPRQVFRVLREEAVGEAFRLVRLPDDAVIEVPAVVGTDGAVPVPADPVDPLLRGLIAHVYAYEELALDAAIRGGRDRVYDALLAHPLVGQAEQARCLTDRLLAENAPYLPWA